MQRCPSVTAQTVLQRTRVQTRYCAPNCLSAASRQSQFAGLPQSVAPRDILKALGPKLLGLLVSERAIALNRAAAADTSGELGKALAKGGRETVLPMIEAAELYINLLVGGVQVRRLISVIAPLNDVEITMRSDRAYRMTLKLLGQ